MATTMGTSAGAAVLHRQGGVGQVSGATTADQALTALYTAHYRRLVRLAAFLLHDRDSAEEVVQDAYVAVHRQWHSVRDLDRAEAYLRQAVVNGSRSRLRHRSVVERHTEPPLPDTASAECGALGLIERSAVVQALAGLPQRQREAVVLRYYANLSAAQTAHAMGISTGAVKSHTSRAMSALRLSLGESLKDQP